MDLAHSWSTISVTSIPWARSRAMRTSDTAAGRGLEGGRGWRGIARIACRVESLEATAGKRAAVGSEGRHDINEALGVGPGPDHRYGNVEVKYSGPDGVTVDVSETGWAGTSGFSA